MSTTLVTGGCGFIGSNFIRYYLARHPGHRVVNLDLLTYAGNLANVPPGGSPGYEFVRGDVADMQALENVYRRFLPSKVVHFAAESHVDRSIDDASPFIRTNVQGTLNVLELCRRHPVDRYVQVSTDEVYGALRVGDPAFTEETPLAPNSPYAASKASADLLARAYFRTHGVPVMVTRCSNNYGPYQFPEKLVPLVILRAMQDKPVPVYGDGLQIRDWVHVDDHCRAIDDVLQKGAPGEVYNVGGHFEVPNVTVVREILRLLGKPDTLIEYVADRKGHDRRYAVNTDKIRRNLNWRPEIGFTGGLHDTVKWYRENEQWVTSVLTKDYLNYYERTYGRAA